MIKYFTLLFLSLMFAAPAMAQVPDRTETDCDQAQETVYQHLDQGKILLIAAQGLDCTGCQDNAAYLDTFATNHMDNIRVWSALNLILGGGDCNGVNTWIQDYGYQDIFTFLDDTQHWQNTYLAEWIVINPMDKSVYHSGLIRETALEKARELEQLVVGIGEPEQTNPLSFTVSPNPFINKITLNLEDYGRDDLQVDMMNLLGETVHSQTIPRHLVQKSIELEDLDGLSNGYYFIRLSMGETQQTLRLVKN